MEQHPQLLVYKASAGSGKTFTLAVHYIRQLIEDPYAYRRILAVTFTNKATAEMKERILEQLYGIATADEGSEGYLKEIQKTSTKSVEEIRESAREALRHIIHDYSRFRIETIDSFFQSVMRNLARELELGANLSIELNNTEVLSDAVDAMIEKLDRRSPVLYWLLEYIEERIVNDRRWDVSKDIKGFGQNIFDESYIEKGEGLRRKLADPNFIPSYRDELKSIREEVLEFMKGFSEQFTGLLEMHGLTPADLKNGSRGIGSYFNKLANGKLSDDIRNATVEKCLESEENWTTKTSAHRDEIRSLAASELIPLLAEAENRRPQNNLLLNSCDLSLRYLNNLRLLAHIDEEVRLQNQAHNRFLLSDTNALLHSLIREGDASFVYEKIGTTIDTVMIDEFQDTSRMQWENFHLLLQESLAQRKAASSWATSSRASTAGEAATGKFWRDWAMTGVSASRNVRSTRTGEVRRASSASTTSFYGGLPDTEPALSGGTGHALRPTGTSVQRRAAALCQEGGEGIRKGDLSAGFQGAALHGSDLEAAGRGSGTPYGRGYPPQRDGHSGAKEPEHPRHCRLLRRTYPLPHRIRRGVPAECIAGSEYAHRRTAVSFFTRRPHRTGTAGGSLSARGIAQGHQPQHSAARRPGPLPAGSLPVAGKRTPFHAAVRTAGKVVRVVRHAAYREAGCVSLCLL